MLKYKISLTRKQISNASLRRIFKIFEKQNSSTLNLSILPLRGFTTFH